MSSPQKLAATYRGNLFVGIGYVEGPALDAFVGTFVANTLGVFLVGAALSMLGFVLIGPTRREIQRRQEQIHGQGSPLSLVAALSEPPRPGTAHR